MSTCFIFFDAAAMPDGTDLPTVFWAVRLDETGEVDVALSEHTIDEIKLMQRGARTVIVLPAVVASIYCLDLPKLSLRKAREAIPYALEESLAEPVQDVHVAFDKAEANSSYYYAVALTKRRLNAWVHLLETLDLAFDVMTLDWCALKPDEVCMTDKDLLVREDASVNAINGALSSSVAAEYMEKNKKNKSIHPPESTSYRLFIATRLLNHTVLNICQGDFQRKTDSKGLSFWYAVCAGLLGVLFLSVLGLKAFLLHQLHAKEAVVDEKIKVIYHDFFPEATQAISPRFRIEQFLKTHASDIQSPFWQLLNKMSNVFSKSDMEHDLQIEHIQFQDQKLSVRLNAKNFAALEAFEQQLKKQQVTVTQIEASTRHGQVISTVELE